MELGFARFLEMFEERFGRIVTTILMAMLALAAAGWAIQTTIEASVYVYHLVQDADFIAALKSEHAATHLVIFAIQIVFTFIILSLIWRFYWQRQIKTLEDDVEASQAKITKRIEDMEMRAAESEADLAKREEELNQRTQQLMERMAQLRARQEKLLSARPEVKPPLELPRQVQEPQDKPEKT